MSSPSQVLRRRLWGHTGAAWLLFAGLLSGCSLGVMAGKMLVGDPQQASTFKQIARVDLTKGKHQVLVICNTPDYVNATMSSLRTDLSDGIARRMKNHKIKVIDPDEVSTWIDEHAGEGTDPQLLAADFKTDYIVVIDIQAFDYREPNSPKLLRGNAHGFVRAYKVEDHEGAKLAGQVFATEFRVTHPRHTPVSEIGRSPMVFQQEFRDRFCDEIAESFYDHRHGANF